MEQKMQKIILPALVITIIFTCGILLPNILYSPTSLKIATLLVESDHSRVIDIVPLTGLTSLKHESKESLKHESEKGLKHELGKRLKHESEESRNHELEKGSKHAPKKSLKHESEESLKHESKEGSKHELEKRSKHKSEESLKCESKEGLKHEQNKILKHESGSSTSARIDKPDTVLELSDAAAKTKTEAQDQVETKARSPADPAEVGMRTRARVISKRCQQLPKAYRMGEKLARKHDYVVAYRTQDHKKFNFYFMTIKKCGFTTWKTIFHEAMINAGYNPAKIPMNEWNITGMERVPTIQPNIQLQRYSERILFVRHPYDRLVSAYKNKALQYPKYLRLWEKDCLKKYGGENKTVPLSFSQFVSCCLIDNAKSHSRGKFPLSSYVATKQLDPHWKPQVYLSMPCEVKYSLIGEFNNLSSDINASLKLMKLDRYATLKHTNPSNKMYDSLSEWYNQLDEQLRRDVKEIYKFDFQVFGYNSTMP